MMKKIYSIITLILCFTVYNALFTRDGSIKVGLLLSGYNPFTDYENIDYENGNSYLNQIEIDNQIIYLECKTYGVFKVASFHDFKDDDNKQ